MTRIYQFTKLFPIKFPIAGPKPKLLLDLSDKFFFLLKKELVTGPDNLSFDLVKRNDRFLYLFFNNITNHYTESPLGKYLKKIQKKGGIFLDIGANMGNYAYLAKKLGYEAWLFEPEPNHFEFIKRNQNIFDKVFDLALSSTAGEAAFYVAKDDNLGGNSLVQSNKDWNESGYSHTMKVKTQRLDEIITDEQTIDRIQFAKIDTEGSESSVLKGMTHILQKNKFDIWCEVRGSSSDRNPNSYKEVSDFLKKFGYQPYIYDGKTIKEFNKEHITQVFDLLFICDRKLS